MRISNITLNKDGDLQVLSAQIGERNLYYRFPEDVAVTRSADPFVAAALLPSMLEGTPIEVCDDLPVSDALCQNIHELQEIFHCWNPLLKPVEIRCSVEKPRSPTGRVGSFYSGGVDSNHTLLRHLETISDLIPVNGFDFEMDHETFAKVLARIRPVADSFKKNVVPVETNFFSFGQACGLRRTLSQGSCLASIGLALGFSKVYIPSSHTYAEMSPWGSHPLTDRLWSNGTTELIHDGAAFGRVEKLAEIARFPAILDNISVCWNKPDRNCGYCPKCLRSMITLRLMGISSAGLPKLVSVKTLRKVRIYEEIESQFILENLKLSVEKEDRKIERALRKILRRYEINRGLLTVDRFLFRGWLRRIYRIYRPAEPSELVGFTHQRLM